MHNKYLAPADDASRIAFIKFRFEPERIKMMSTVIKRTYGLLAISLCLINPAFAGDDGNTSCNNSTLKGTYIFSVSGALSTGKNTYVPEAYAGLISYDGIGNIILKKTSFINGTWVTRITEGSYLIQSDCTGRVIYPGGPEFVYYVAPDGENISFVQVGNYDGTKSIESPDRISSTALRVSRHQTRFIAPN